MSGSKNLGCDCPDPAVCEMLGRHIHGRLWELWTGTNGVSRSKSEKYRRALLDSAGINLPEKSEGTQPATQKPVQKPRRTLLERYPCRHRSSEPVGEGKCRTCGKEKKPIKIYGCELYERCTVTRARLEGEKILKACRTCDSRSENLPKKPAEPSGVPAMIKPTKKTPKAEFVLGHDGEPADWWQGWFAPHDGSIATVFLVCGGVSMREFDWQLLEQPGIFTAAVNNAPLGRAWKSLKPQDVFRPDVWFCVDDPKNFHEIIWRDRSVMKFLKRRHKGYKYRTRKKDGHWKATGTAHDAPNVWQYLHDKRFPSDKFFYGKPTWGSNPNRSVMFVALRVLHWLGFQRVILLGADFNQKAGDDSYSFVDPMPSTRAQYNTDKFRRIDDIFTKLRPQFEDYGLQVLNATAGSQLDTFDKISVQDAIAAATAGFPKEINPEGLYLKK